MHHTIGGVNIIIIIVLQLYEQIILLWGARSAASSTEVTHTQWMTNLLFHAAALAFKLDQLGRSSESPITLNCPTTGLLPTVTFWEKNGEDLVSGGTYEITTKLRDRRTTIFDNYLRIYQTPQQAEGIYRCHPVSSMDGPVQNNNFTRSLLFDNILHLLAY